MEKTLEIQLKEQRELIACQIEEMNFGFPKDATSEGKLAVYEFLRIVADHIRGLPNFIDYVEEDEDDALQDGEAQLDTSS
jgi:hypothetical protein